MGRRHRWMYYATGQPGWMRFGFSPGWVGRSPTGLGPCATFLMTGQWPGPPAWAAPGGPVPFPAWGAMPFAGPAPSMPKEQELQMLKSQAQWIKQQLEQINQRIAELEKE
jgi:hypothetical protein